MWIFLRKAVRLSAIYLYGATGEILTEKSGHLNLGTPGIMCMGAIGGCLGVRAYVGTLSSLAQMNGFAVVLIGIICAFLFGMLGGLIYSFLTVTLRCNQNVTGLTLTTFGAGLMSFVLSSIDQTGFSEASEYFRMGFVNGQDLDWFSTLFLNYGTLVYLAIAIAIIAAIVLKKTRTGLNLRAVGENPATADAAGISVGKYRYFATLTGAGIAGLGGLCYIMDSLLGTIDYEVEAFGWIAVALVIFSIWKPDLAIVGSLLFGILLNAADAMQILNKGLIKTLPYVVTVIVLVITSIINKRETQPPAALGTSYFREER